MIFTVEQLPGDRSEINIFCDDEGLEMLDEQVEILKRNHGHVHLMTPSWSGSELTEQKHLCGSELINHVKINYVGRKEMNRLANHSR